MSNTNNTRAVTKLNQDVISNSSSDILELVGAIDQGTSSTRFLVFTKQGKIAAWSQMEHTQIFFSEDEHKVGWHEHDPFEIWTNVKLCMQHVIEELNSTDKQYKIKSIGITNQRETTVAWNATTGQPYYNAIVWDDTRTSHIAASVAKGDPDRLRNKTGLPLASYFAGTKVKWLLDHVPLLQTDMDMNADQVRFGTIDTWLLYQLTGSPSSSSSGKGGNVGGHFKTDVSNASRWLFCDIHSVQWDSELVNTVCHPHKVPLACLPEICASSQVFGLTTKAATGIVQLEKVPIASILGDQQAALFGQCCFAPGQAKNTYGTGMFLMMNTGTFPINSKSGLLTTIAFSYGEKVYYALEGSVSHSGSTIQWLRDQLQIITCAKESETLATKENDGLYFVPAFSGLFAPHWRSDARACIVGMSASHHKGHICRAALEAAAYQTKEVFDAIYTDSRVKLKQLKVDGGGTNNSLLMQFQADMINVPVIIPEIQETTSMGAAFCAGLAVGFFSSIEEIQQIYAPKKQFTPQMTPLERKKNWSGWQKAITRSLDWENPENDSDEEEEEVFQDAMEYDISLPKFHAEAEQQGFTNTSLLVMTTVLGFGAGLLLGRKWK